MSFQRCPICDGTGFDTRADSAIPCPTCEGKRIISSESGRPPAGSPQTTAGGVPDIKPEDIMRPLSPFDELSDDEVLYWSTPHYDEIQAQKEAQIQAKKESEDEPH